MRMLRILSFKLINSCIEFSYYDRKQVLRHIHSSPFDLTNQWNHLLCTVVYNVNQGKSTFIKAFLNTKKVFEEVIYRSEKVFRLINKPVVYFESACW